MQKNLDSALPELSVMDFARVLQELEASPALRGWDVELAQKREGGVCLRNRRQGTEHHIARFQGKSAELWPFLPEPRPSVLARAPEVIAGWGLERAQLRLEDLVEDEGAAQRVLGAPLLPMVHAAAAAVEVGEAGSGPGDM